MIFITFFLTTITNTAFPIDPPETDDSLKKAEEYQANIPIEVIRKVELPKGYHEGLFIEGNKMWVNNGEKGKTWIIDLSSGKVISEIEPPGTFSEGISAAPDGKFWITDWDTKKLYLTKIEENKMIPVSEKSLEPGRPTGVVWNGSNLYVITWTRGIGTKYHLLKMDKEGNILHKVRIKRIHEPSQLAWDGKNLWISSWYNQRVYKIDVNTLQIVGHFRSPVNETTGIVWDGKYMWVTGTKSDLYQVKLGAPSE